MIKLGNVNIDSVYLGDQQIYTVYNDDINILQPTEDLDVLFRYRALPNNIATGKATINEIRGKSLVWNQLVQNGNFENTNGWGLGGFDLATENNVLTATANSSVQSSTVFFQTITTIVNHKYLCHIDVNPSKSGTLTFGLYGALSNLNVTANSWNSLKVIASYSSVQSILRFMVGKIGQVLPNEGDSIQFRNANLIDLTLMFGEGNEPSTVEEFETLFPLPYYSYNSGEIINTTCAATKKVVWNQLIAPTTTQTLSGVTFTQNQDGSITLSGTATATARKLILDAENFIVGHKYYLRGGHPGDVLASQILTASKDGAYNIVANPGVIFSPIAGSQYVIWIRVASGVNVDNVTYNPNLIDLTLLGIDNLTTPEQVEAWLSEYIGVQDYYPYDAGTLKTITLVEGGIKTVGFNQLNLLGRTQHDLSDKATRPADKKNFSESEYWNGFAYNGYYIVGSKHTNIVITEGSVSATASSSSSYGVGFPVKCIPNTTYYLKSQNSAVGFFNEDGVNIGYSTNNLFTTPINCTWIVVVVGRMGSYTNYTVNNICLNTSNASKNGTYEPYKTSTLNLNLTTITGKLNGVGESIVPFPDGIRGVGEVFDIITKTGAIKKFRVVDLGTLNISANVTTEGHKHTLFAAPSDAKIASLPSIAPVALCPAYLIKSWNNVYGNIADKILTISKVNNNDRIAIYDSSFATKTNDEIKDALSGVPLIYELATPEEYVLDQPIEHRYNVYAGGTEEIIYSDYEILEYLESDGNCWIDTGIIPSQTLPFECKFYNTSTTAPGYGNVFGSRLSSGSNEYQLSNYNNGIIGIGTNSRTTISTSTSTVNTVNFDGDSTAIVNGTSKYITTSAINNNSYSIILFGINTESNPIQLQAGKIYYCKFGDKGYFLPVRNTKTNELGMLDLVSGNLFVNKGSGSFTGGPVIGDFKSAPFAANIKYPVKNTN